MLPTHFNEADTRTKLITPQIIAAGWDTAPHSFQEEVTFTDGRITVRGKTVKRGQGKRADYLLRYKKDFLLAVVEAKNFDRPASSGLQQAKDYADILGIPFAYSTNGQELVEFDFFTGLQRVLTAFPTPDELWQRYQAGKHLTPDQTKPILEDARFNTNRRPRYYQEIAINRTIEAIAKGQKRILLTMATGTGKTFTAFQICWKLHQSKWNQTGTNRKPRILFLADRNILVDDPYTKDFAVFGEARSKIGQGHVTKGREMYFAIYQAIAETELREGLYRDFPPDFFDLIIVDECHRGSAKDESNWREVLEYFEPAYQLGLTATPRRDDNVDTYTYFGNPIYTYSLKQGIEDGFLAPYTVHRVVTNFDAVGWRPEAGQTDRYGEEIPDKLYTTNEFEREIVISPRNQAIARHITEFMRQNGADQKTILFCVDQNHALEMRDALIALNPDHVRQYPNYVCRITADEQEIGRRLLSDFQDPEQESPVIVTTSQLLTTGVDIPTCQNIVLLRVIKSMTEFKQIIGRGTRVRDDFNKLFFNILDYTGSATTLFADPEFDGYPAIETEIAIDEQGVVISEERNENADPTLPELELDTPPDLMDPKAPRKKLYLDEGEVEIVAELVYQLDAEGKPFVEQYSDYTAKQVRSVYRNLNEMREEWTNPTTRDLLIEQLQDLGIDFDHLAHVTKQPEADAFDLLCHVAFNAPIRTRRERAQRLYQEESAFFATYGDTARQILLAIVEKYAEHGYTQFNMKELLKLPPISNYGNTAEIINLFGGAAQLKQAIEQLQSLLYAA